MRKTNFTRVTFYFVALFLLSGLQAWGLRPIYHYNSLVAGEGGDGYQDGSFDSALFHAPLGLAVNSDSTRLYVADYGNERIRVIDLAHDNEVSTLAGTGTQGYLDGPVSQAMFSRPTGLAYLPGDLLLVNDHDSARIRSIDLKSMTVTTLAGNGQGGLAEGDALKVPMDGVGAIAYSDKGKALYLSRPALGAVQKLDLNTKKVTTVFKDQPQFPHPNALCLFNDKLIVADQALSQVGQLQLTAQGGVTFLPSGTGEQIVALSASGNYLYALQADNKNPMIRLMPRNEPVTFVSVWGDPTDGLKLPCFLNLSQQFPPGFTADPTNERRFFISNPNRNVITSVHDLFLNALLDSGSPNSNGASDFEYPEKKPPHTFRILLAGDSHTFFTLDDDHKDLAQSFSNRMQTMAKRLELELNTQAALRDVPMNFEVLFIGKLSWGPLLVWTSHEIPPLVKKYDVDLALLMLSPDYGNSLSAYYQRPTDSDGIPTDQVDPEYLLKPYKEKIPDGIPRKMYELAKAKKWINISTKGDQINFVDNSRLMTDPDTRTCLIKMMGKPLGLLNQKLTQTRTSGGQPVKFQPFLLPTGNENPALLSIGFWRDVFKEENLTWGDFTPEFTALRTTYHPFSEIYGGDHFNANGHLLFSVILANKLIEKGLIPWSPKQTTNTP